MISVEEYRGRLLADVDPLSPIELPISSARGCVLAEPVIAAWSLPPFDNSAMDGYALRAADVAGASAEHPVELAVAADVAAGDIPAGEVAAMTAQRIMTGAPVPAGADAVVPVEKTDGGTERVRIMASAKPGDCIRPAGEDVQAGALVLEPGAVLSARQIALLAGAGRANVLAHPQPRVLVLSTGSELVDPGTPLTGAHIPDSNGPMLAALVEESGASVVRCPPITDDEESLLAALDDRLHMVDLVITSGGVSMGAYDIVKSALTRSGEAAFMKVAMQPGMPQGHGRLQQEGGGSVPIITLPGNPVSAYVSFEVFVRPVIRRMQGHLRLDRPMRMVRSTRAFTSPANKRQYLRGRLVGAGAVEPVGGAGSHLLGGLGHSDCLIVVPEHVTAVAIGQEVQVMDLWSGA